MNKKEFEQQYGGYLLFDDPIEYKKLLIYPVSMKDFYKFNFLVESIIEDKNAIPNPDVITMSYLDFLFWKSQQSQNGLLNLSYMFNLLSLCLHIDMQDIKFIQNENDNFILGFPNDITIDKDDFNDLRKIICYQNMIELSEDDCINPDIKRAMEEAEEFKRKHKRKMGSLEDQIICLMISTGLSSDYIKNMSIRKFEKALLRVDYTLHYKAMINGSYSGMVTFKKEPDNWMCDLTKDDKYEGDYIDFETFSNRISNPTSSQ